MRYPASRGRTDGCPVTYLVSTEVRGIVSEAAAVEGQWKVFLVSRCMVDI